MIRGYLIYRSGYLPRALGAPLAIAGLGFITRNVVLVLAPPYASDLRGGTPGSRLCRCRVQRVASVAHCVEFIERMPERSDTVVGERGVKLSGGQQQRAARNRFVNPGEELPANTG